MKRDYVHLDSQLGKLTSIGVRLYSRLVSAAVKAAVPAPAAVIAALHSNTIV